MYFEVHYQLLNNYISFTFLSFILKCIPLFFCWFSWLPVGSDLCPLPVHLLEEEQFKPVLVGWYALTTLFYLLVLAISFGQFAIFIGRGKYCFFVKLKIEVIVNDPPPWCLGPDENHNREHKKNVIFLKKTRTKYGISTKWPKITKSWYEHKYIFHADLQIMSIYLSKRTSICKFLLINLGHSTNLLWISRSVAYYSKRVYYI